MGAAFIGRHIFAMVNCVDCKRLVEDDPVDLLVAHLIVEHGIEPHLAQSYADHLRLMDGKRIEGAQPNRPAGNR